MLPFNMFPKIWLYTLRILVIVIFSIVTICPYGYAQRISDLPVGAIHELPLPTGNVSSSLRGLRFHPKEPFRFDFILDQGNENNRRGLIHQTQSEGMMNHAPTDIEQESTKLIKYFLSTLTIPNDHLWVNLSPYEKDRMISTDFGQTAMGMTLLEQDYLLKQIMASMLDPQRKIGQEFWKNVYAKAYEKFGTTNIPINTFNKVWILPDQASLLVKDNTVWLLHVDLKVMLEEDYLSLNKNIVGAGSPGPNPKGGEIPPLRNTNFIASQIIREIILPELKREVNEGQNFAPLRQIVHSMVLAAWYKKELKTSLLSKVYANRGKVGGLKKKDAKQEEKIFQNYLKAYKKGVFNFIKEEPDGSSGKTIARKYFSGGFNPQEALDKAMVYRDFAQVPVNVQRQSIQEFSKANLFLVKSQMKIQKFDAAMAQGEQEDDDIADIKNIVNGFPVDSEQNIEDAIKALQEQRDLFESIGGLDRAVEYLTQKIEEFRKRLEDMKAKAKQGGFGIKKYQQDLEDLNRKMDEIRTEIQQKTAVSKVLYDEPYLLPETDDLTKVAVAMREAHKGFLINYIFSYRVKGWERYISVGGGGKAWAFDGQGNLLQEDPLSSDIAKAHNGWEISFIFSYEFRGQKRHISGGQGGKVYSFDDQGVMINNDLLAKAIRLAHSGSSVIYSIFTYKVNGKSVYISAGQGGIFAFDELGNKVETPLFKAIKDAHEGSSIRFISEYEVDGHKRYMSLGANGKVFAFDEQGNPINDPLVQAIAKAHGPRQTLKSLFTFEVQGQKRYISVGTDSRAYAFDQNGIRIFDSFTDDSNINSIFTLNMDGRQRLIKTEEGPSVYIFGQDKLKSPDQQQFLKEKQELETQLKSLEAHKIELEKLISLHEQLIQVKDQIEAKKVLSNQQPKQIHREWKQLAETEPAAKLAAILSGAHGSLAVLSLMRYKAPNGDEQVLSIDRNHSILVHKLDGTSVISDLAEAMKSGPYVFNSTMLFDQGQKVLAVGPGGIAVVYKLDGTIVQKHPLAENIRRFHGISHIFSATHYHDEDDTKILVTSGRVSIHRLDGTVIKNHPLEISIDKARGGDSINHTFFYPTQDNSPAIWSIGKHAKVFVHKLDGTRVENEPLAQLIENAFAEGVDWRPIHFFSLFRIFLGLNDEQILVGGHTGKIFALGKEEISSQNQQQILEDKQELEVQLKSLEAQKVQLEKLISLHEQLLQVKDQIEAKKALSNQQTNQVYREWKQELIEDKVVVAGGGNQVFAFEQDENNIHSQTISDNFKAKAIAITPNGNFLVAGNNEGIIHFFSKDITTGLWNLFDKVMLMTAGKINAIAFSKTSDLCIVVGQTEVAVFKYSSGGIWLRAPVESSSNIDSVAISPQGDYFVTIGNGKLLYWTYNKASNRWGYESIASASGAMDISSDGNSIIIKPITGGFKIMTRNPQTLQWTSFDLGGADSSPNFLQLSPDQKLILVIYENGAWVFSGPASDTGLLVAKKLSGQTQRILSGRFTPDSKYLITSGEEGENLVWMKDDASGTWTISKSLPSHSEKITASTISEDGKFLMSVGKDLTIKVTQIAESMAPTRKELELLPPDQIIPIQVLEAQKGFYRSSAIAPDGSFLVTVRDEVIMWKNSKGQWIDGHLLEGHEGGVRSVAIAPKSDFFVTAGDGGKILIWMKKPDGGWDIPKILDGFKGNETVRSVAIAPDGSFFIATGDHAKVLIWTKDDQGQWNWKAEKLFLGDSRSIHSVAISKDSKFFVTTGDYGDLLVWTKNAIDVWESSKQSLPNLHNGPVRAVAISPDNSFFVTVGYVGPTEVSGEALIWSLDLSTGLWVPKVLPGITERLESVVISPDNRFFVITGEKGQVWILTQDKKSNEWMIYKNLSSKLRTTVFSATISPDGTSLITTRRDGMAVVWNVAKLVKQAADHESLAETRKKLEEQKHLLEELIAHYEELLLNHTQMDQAKQKKEEIAKGSQKQLELLPSDQFKMVDSLPTHKDWVRASAIAPNGNFLVTIDGKVRLRNKKWNAGTSKFEWEYLSLPTLNQGWQGMRSVAIASDSSFFVTVGDSGKVLIWTSDASGQWSFKLLEGHLGDVNSVAIASDNSFFVTTGVNGEVLKWNRDTQGQFSPKESLDGHTQIVTSVAIASDNSFFVTTGEQGEIFVWKSDAQGDWQGVQHQSLSASSHVRIQSVAIAPNGLFFLTVGSKTDRGEVLLWTPDASSRRWVSKSLYGGTKLQSVVISPNSRFFITTGEHGHIQIWYKDQHSNEWQFYPSFIAHQGKTVLSASLFPDGTSLITTGQDRDVSIWQVARTVGDEKDLKDIEGAITTLEERKKQLEEWIAQAEQRLAHMNQPVQVALPPSPEPGADGEAFELPPTDDSLELARRIEDYLRTERVTKSTDIHSFKVSEPLRGLADSTRQIIVYPSGRWPHLFSMNIHEHKKSSSGSGMTPEPVNQHDFFFDISSSERIRFSLDSGKIKQMGSSGRTTSANLWFAMNDAHANSHINYIFMYKVRGQLRFLSMGEEGKVFAFDLDGNPIEDDQLVKLIRAKFKNETIAMVFEYSLDNGERRFLVAGGPQVTLHVFGQKEAKDTAQLSAKTPGGIDLNPDHMAMKVNQEGQAKLDLAMETALNIHGTFTGLDPVILEIISFPLPEFVNSHPSLTK